MTPSAPTAKQRMILSAALLIREKGARATSIDDVLAHSGAPRGSVYHHFPGGRDQLLRDATTLADNFVAASLERLDSSDPVAAIDTLLDGFRRGLVKSEFRSGCPIVAVAVEAREDDQALQDQAGAAFVRWQAILGRRFADAGISQTRAAELALLSISAIEGGLILARAQRDLAPLDGVRDQLVALIEAEMPKTGSA